MQGNRSILARNTLRFTALIVVVVVIASAIYDSFSDDYLVSQLQLINTSPSPDKDNGSIKYPFTTTVKSCPKITPNELKSRGLHKSQEGEDLYLLQWFNGLCDGTYIEMGAVDGVSLSNTYALHKGFNWKGLLIELSPQSYEELAVNRPDDVTVNAAVCNQERELHFWYNPEQKFRAGVYEFLKPSLRKGIKIEDTTPVQCKPMDDIIQQRYSKRAEAASTSESNFFDFFSLDVEGSELQVLQSIDFETTAFGVLVVEANGQNEARKNLAMRMFLEARGYIFYAAPTHRNYWFINKHFAEIYKDTIL